MPHILCRSSSCGQQVARLASSVICLVHKFNQVFGFGDITHVHNASLMEFEAKSHVLLDWIKLIV